MRRLLSRAFKTITYMCAAGLVVFVSVRAYSAWKRYDLENRMAASADVAARDLQDAGYLHFGPSVFHSYDPHETVVVGWTSGGKSKVTRSGEPVLCDLMTALQSELWTMADESCEVCGQREVSADRKQFIMDAYPALAAALRTLRNEWSIKSCAFLTRYRDGEVQLTVEIRDIPNDPASTREKYWKFDGMTYSRPAF